ncbi:class I SAM-dependent methyltransferase [Gimesia alba]|nr:class I SAM-dependent methyltransferase [Gimesia alba]
MNKHPESFPELDQLGVTLPEYLPTFDFPGAYIDSSHAVYAECPVNEDDLVQVEKSWWSLRKMFPGWLRRADALKLYEMAYFVQGDILEVGSYHGLSTTILAEAARQSPWSKHIYSIDMSPKCVKKAKYHLRKKKLDRGVTNICNEGTAAVKALKAEGKQFEFAFIDHSHEYDPVFSVCRELDSLVVPGGFCLFHDFNDQRNSDPEAHDYGVYQAVTEGLDPDKFEFYGLYGCTGLYRMKPSQEMELRKTA